MEKWRWDQGRLIYFRFENLKAIAQCLVELEGSSLDTPDIDPLRDELEANTGLPFLPSNYKIWRNYARIFACALLATRINGRLVVTDICRRVAGLNVTSIDVDEYIAFIISRFYFPSPAFQNYNATSQQIFPFCALLKYLLSRFMETGEASINVQEVFSLIVGNRCSGSEPINYYLSLSPTSYSPSGDETRQLREMLIFVSQLSFLKWYDNRLHIDIIPGDLQNLAEIEQITTPIYQNRNENSKVEIISLGRVGNERLPHVALTTREMPTDLLFTEGRRIRVTHLRIERSPRLRRLYFLMIQEPILCDMCVCNTRERYPWTDNLLEIHHLLPLSATLSVTTEGTSLEDIVALCPNCHKSVHAYYRNWLNQRSIDDFRSKDEARGVYQEVKSEIRL